MLPTCRQNQVHLINRLAYRFHPPRRGDVVLVVAPSDTGITAYRFHAPRRGDVGAIPMAVQHAMLLKRIVGLPGETVAFHDGRLFINGQMLDEPYVRFSSDWEMKPVPVGPDWYYVVGDNRSMAWEDHEQGRSSRECIVGKLLL
jgi:signal peptidase I